MALGSAAAAPPPASAVLTPPSGPLPHHSTSPTGLLALDRRLIDPRRPLGEPRDMDKAEGLAQYSPYLPLRHSWLLNHGVPLRRVRALLPAATAWESTSLVTSVGVDHFVARVAPARKFDTLDPDFNPGLFVALLAGAAVATAVLGRLAARKDTAAAWQ